MAAPASWSTWPRVSSTGSSRACRRWISGSGRAASSWLERGSVESLHGMSLAAAVLWLLESRRRSGQTACPPTNCGRGRGGRVCYGSVAQQGIARWSGTLGNLERGLGGMPHIPWPARDLKCSQLLRRRTGLLPAREKWMWSGQMGTESMIQIRKGQAPAPLERAEPSVPGSRALPRSRIPRRGSVHRAPRGHRLARLQRGTQGAVHARRARVMPTPTTTCPTDGSPRNGA